MSHKTCVSIAAAVVSTIKHILASDCGGDSSTSFEPDCQALADVGFSCLGIIYYLENLILILFRGKHQVRLEVSFELLIELLKMKI